MRLQRAPTQIIPDEMRRTTELANSIADFDLPDWQRDRTAAELSAEVMPVSYQYEPSIAIDARRHGVQADNSTDDYAALARALSVAAQTVNGTTGAVVELPTGTILLGSTVMLPNRVTLKGAMGRGTYIAPHSSFASSYMFHAVNGTSSMFGSRLEDMHIDARGKNMTAVVYSQAWQETCGMERVVIQYDGTTSTGFLYSDGFGGANYLRFDDVEIFANSTAANDIGIDIGQVSLVGAFKLHLLGITIIGDPINVLSKCVRMVNDTLIVQGFHTEYSAIGLSMEGAGSLDVSTATGSSNSTGTLITLGAGFTGSVNGRCLIPNGAAGPTIDNNITGKDVLASDGMLAEYTYPIPKFSANVSADILNVTGNNTAYTVIFNTERYDELGEYNTATGIYTCQRAGKYAITANVRLNLPVGSTSVAVDIVTTGKDNYVFRGGADNIRDASSNVNLGGTIIVELADGDTARVIVTVNGLGADTVDVLATESEFTLHWLSR